MGSIRWGDFSRQRYLNINKLLVTVYIERRVMFYETTSCAIGTRDKSGKE